MECQILFSAKIRKISSDNLSSAEFAQRVVKVNKNHHWNI